MLIRCYELPCNKGSKPSITDLELPQNNSSITQGTIWVGWGHPISANLGPVSSYVSETNSESWHPWGRQNNTIKLMSRNKIIWAQDEFRDKPTNFGPKTWIVGRIIILFLGNLSCYRTIAYMLNLQTFKKLGAFNASPIQIHPFLP